MNASYAWLKDFVDIDMSPVELRDVLTMRCATVDDVVQLRQDLSGIVVGRVIEAAPTRTPITSGLPSRFGRGCSS